MLKVVKNNSYRGDDSYKVFYANDPQQKPVCNIRKVNGYYENDRFSMYPLFPTIKQTLEKLASFNP